MMMMMRMMVVVEVTSLPTIIVQSDFGLTVPSTTELVGLWPVSDEVSPRSSVFEQC